MAKLSPSDWSISSVRIPAPKTVYSKLPCSARSRISSCVAVIVSPGPSGPSTDPPSVTCVTRVMWACAVGDPGSYPEAISPSARGFPPSPSTAAINASSSSSERPSRAAICSSSVGGVRPCSSP